ncbi:WD repeat-containing protein 43 [Arctopsyche grandis]|uniref:WD repeat-containing protein 43 n=1 Tax=Arctopsyche grandis TaxID=121162 RepID=UPI00406D6DC9
MGAPNEGGSFSNGGSRYCSVGNGRARLWSSAGGGARAPHHEITPDGHLSTRLRALTWLRLQNDAPPQILTKRKNRKRKSSKVFEEDDRDTGESSHIAFGTSDGKILIYSVALAKVETILEDSSADPGDQQITCLDWNSGYGLYSCSADSTIKEWSITDNDVKSKFNMNTNHNNTQMAKTTAIKLIPDKWGSSQRKFMLSAACQLRLWCLDTKTVLRTMIGHTSEVYHLDVMCFPSDNRLYVLSGSKSDRILSFWCVNFAQGELNTMNCSNGDLELLDTSQSKKKHSISKSRKSEVDTIKNPSCNFLMEDIPKHVSFMSSDISSSKIKLSVVTRSGVVHYYEHTLNGVSTKPVKPNVTVQVATEDAGSIKPTAIMCCYISIDSILLGYSLGLGMIFEHVVPNTSEKVQVLIRANKDQSKKETAKQLSESITKIRHAEDDSSVVYLSAALGRTDNSSFKRSAEGKKVDVPMESRLANLSIATLNNKQNTDSKNMTQLLIQALHSKDSKLLQSVFECTDKEVAVNTLNNLPIQYVSPLMDYIVEMLSGKTKKCRSACIWAEALCKAKSSALLSLGSVGSSKVCGLRSALAARVPSLPALLGLKSRLTLTLHSMSGTTNTPVSQEPLLEYNDSSSGDEMGDEMDEALRNNVESDSGSWNEEEDLDEDNENDANSSKESNHGMSESEDNVSDSD